MYCKLKKQYALRGWDKLPWAIQNTDTGQAEFLDELAFQAASFCNGLINLENPVVLPVHRQLIAQLMQNQAIEPCECGDTLDDNQKYRLIPCRYMKQAHWSITGKCNLRCRHCYMSAPDARYGELSLAQCLDIVRQLAAAGIGRVSLTGGEPLVRRDFLQIVDALLEHRIQIDQIYSNGILVNPKLIQELQSRGLKPAFALSFDGVGCHDWLRGLDGTEKKTIQAINLLRTSGFEVSIETSLHRKNLHTLAETLYLLAKLGVSSWKTSPTSESGDWLQEEGQYTLGVQELFEAYLDLIPQYKKMGSPLNIMLGGFFACTRGNEKYSIPCKKYDGSESMISQTICPSARNTMYIAADGRLLPCIPLTGLPLQEQMPDITETSLVQALRSSRYLDLIDTRLGDLLDANEKCANCPHRLYCGGGCRAGALISCSQYLGCDEFTCYFFLNNYEERIKARWAM